MEEALQKVADPRSIIDGLKLQGSALVRGLELSFTPPGEIRWRRYGGRLFLFLGMILVAASVILFMAYNWSDLHRSHKFGIVQLLLVASTVVAGHRGLDSTVGKAALTCSVIWVGALFAVIGQTYQTGADSFQLFLLWWVLALPWCIAARFAPLWAISALLFNLSLALFWEQRIEAWWCFDSGYQLLASTLNLGALAGWERLSHKHAWMKNRGLPALLAVLALTPWTMGACFLSFDADFPRMFILACLAGTLYLGHRYYTETRPDRLMLALGLASAISVVTFFAGRILLESMEIFGLFLAAIVVIWQVAAAARYLMRIPTSEAEVKSERERTLFRPTLKELLETLTREGELDEEGCRAAEEQLSVKGEPESPWFVKLMIGFGAWVATLFLALFLALTDALEPGLGLGLFLCAGACVLAWKAKHIEFLAQFSLAIHLTGQCLVAAYAHSGGNDWGAWFITMAAFQTLLVFAYPLAIGRFLSTLAAATAAAGFFLQAGMMLSAEAVVILLALLAVVLWHKQPTLLAHPRLRELHGPISYGLTTAVFGVLLLTLGLWRDLPVTVNLLGPGLLLVLGATAYLTGGSMPLSAGLVVALLPTLPAPGIAAALLFAGLGFLRHNLHLQALSFAFLMVFGSGFYYNMDLSLMFKSGVLLLSGIIMLFLSRLSQPPKEVQGA